MTLAASDLNVVKSDFLNPEKTGHAWRASFFLIMAFLLGGLSGCDSGDSAATDRPVRLAGSTMGTTYHITVVNDKPGLSSTELKQKVDETLSEINQKMSTYIGDSELNTLNNAKTYEWFPVSADLYEVIELSLQISELSEGAFDVTVAPLVNLWGFGPGKSLDKVPEQSAVQSALQQTGYQHIRLQQASSAVQKQAPVYIDLSSIAKGFAVDRVAELFDTIGINNYLVEVGGEMFVKGHNPRGEKWKIGVETPSLAHQGAQQTLAVSGVGIATSGDYRNYFESRGQRYSHMIDPRTGYPVTHQMASVTVIAESTAKADALSTALAVAGPEKAMALAEKYSIAAFFIVRDGTAAKEGNGKDAPVNTEGQALLNNDHFREMYTPGFAPYMQNKP